MKQAEETKSRRTALWIGGLLGGILVLAALFWAFGGLGEPAETTSSFSRQELSSALSQAQVKPQSALSQASSSQIPSSQTASSQPPSSQAAEEPSPESSSPQPETPPQEEGVLISGFPIVYQLPQLPTGCEVTALTMALRYYGFQADKEELAREYLPTSPSTYRHTGEDGRVYGVDLDAYFVGSPFDDSGMICGPQAIVTAANRYLADQGSSLAARDLTGASPEELYALVEGNTPVVVWVTIGMAPRQELRMSWYTESGKEVGWSGNDHGAVLVGYSDSAVWIADPLAGLVSYDRGAFESVFASRGNRCVALG